MFNAGRRLKFLSPFYYVSLIYVSHTVGLHLVTFRQSFHIIVEKHIRSYTFRGNPSQFQETNVPRSYVPIRLRQPSRHFVTLLHFDQNLDTFLDTFAPGFRGWHKDASRGSHWDPNGLPGWSWKSLKMCSGPPVEQVPKKDADAGRPQRCH